MKRLFRSAIFTGLIAGAVGRAALAGDEMALFNKLCTPCHGKDGKARTPIGKKLGAKDLSLSKLSDADIEKQIIEGRRSKDGKLLMPAFKDQVTPEEIKVLIAAVKGFRK